MSTKAEYDLSDVLIRAGRRAWELYGEANGTLDEDVGVSLLAKHLVALVGEGITKEGPLAAAGFRYLLSLTTPPSRSMSNDADVANQGVRQPLEFCIGSANAKFIQEWRLRLTKAAAISLP